MLTEAIILQALAWAPSAAKGAALAYGKERFTTELRKDAQAIVRDVRGAVKHWRAVASSHGLSRTAQSQMRSAATVEVRGNRQASAAEAMRSHFSRGVGAASPTPKR